MQPADLGSPQGRRVDGAQGCWPRLVEGVVYRVTNPEAFAEYPAPAIQTILNHGGELLAVDRESEVVEGEPAPVTVLIRFSSKDAAREWYRSQEYQQIVHLRTDNSEGTIVLLDEFVMPEG